jgi:hypothetical protein
MNEILLVILQYICDKKERSPRFFRILLLESKIRGDEVFSMIRDYLK